MADPAPSTDNGALKSKQEAAIKSPADSGTSSSDSGGKQPPESADKSSLDPAGAKFSNTKQNVADRQKVRETTERFANTKHNIALINDPKNGPRFTLTKKESGLDGEAESEAKPDAPEANHVPSRDGIEAGPTKDDGAAKKATSEPEPSNPDTIIDAGEQKSEGETPNLPLGVPPAAAPPSKVPVDSSKTFVGPNGTYYDEAWRWMDWRGTKQSWNWPAALTFGHWFAYRRRYWLAGLYLLWLVGLAAALVNHVHAALILGLLILTTALSGLYANILYFQAFRRAVAHVTNKGEGSYDELKAQLAKTGGISKIAPWIMGAVMTLALGAALGATYYSRGGFLINLWPF